MAFEYDPEKSAANKRKHSMNFEEAKALWDDPEVIEVSARFGSETRSLMIGIIDSKHWTAVLTYRNGNVRLISMRRAREEEVDYYESHRL